MKKIGITGGVGSGKSLVLDYLQEEYDAFICQADLVAHKIEEPGQPCYQKIVEEFGEEILLEDKSINRRKLGRIVFEDKMKLERLNKIVHPEVFRTIRNLIEKEEKEGTGLFVLEAALMTEQIYRDMLDEIWYIHVEVPVRRERLKASRGYTDEKIDLMIQNQPKEEEFRRFCDREIENSMDFECTKKEIKEAFDKIHVGEN